MTGSLWFYSKDEATNFNGDIENTNEFKSFKCKANLLGDTVAKPNPNQANRILKNSTIAMLLKYLSNFWRSLKMPLINCKVELKLRWTKQCVLFVLGAANAGNDGANSNNIVFAIKDTKLYFLLSLYQQQTTKNYPNALAKDLKYWCIRMNIKQK